MRVAKIGFVGCGSHATHNLYPMLPYAKCSLEAVCDLNEKLAVRNSRMFGASSWFTDTERMLSETKLDGVFVVGPPEMHYAVGRKVLERGLALFVEKPPAPDLERTRELTTLAKANGTFIMPGFMKRHGLAYAKTRAMIESGQFEPNMGFFRYGHSWIPSDPRRMLLTMSCHAIDLAISFFGDVSEVVSQQVKGRNIPSLAVTLRFCSGKIAQLMLDSSQPRIQEHVEISGVSDGGNALIIVDNVTHLEFHRQGQIGIDLLGQEMTEIMPEFDLEDIKMWRPDFGIPNMGQTRQFFQGFAGEVREFIDAILEKRQPYPGPRDALMTMTVIEAIAAKPNGTTSLSEIAAG